NSVDLTTYGLERVKLNANIELDESEESLDPQNPNPRGAFGGDEEEDELDIIIRSFNERWFQAWEATPEDQRVKIVTLAKRMQAHPDYQSKFADNPDAQNRAIASNKIFDEVMAKQRKDELDLYRLVTKDDAFRSSILDTLKRVLNV